MTSRSQPPAIFSAGRSLAIHVFAGVLLLFACSQTIYAATDQDGDGIMDAADLDDDNDGILDVDEVITLVAPLNLAGVTGTSPNLSGVAVSKNPNITTTFSATVINSNSTDGGRPAGLENGSLGLGVGRRAFENGEFIEYEIVFYDPVMLEFSQAAQNGNFDRSEEWTVTANGSTLSVVDPTGELGSLSGNGTNQINFIPTRTGGHTSPADSNWSITTMV